MGWGSRLLGPLLTTLLLLHRLYELPYQVPGLPLHLDGLGLVRVVHLQEVLHLPDIGQGASHELYRTLLLLLATLLLLLTALRHYVSLQIGDPIIPTYPCRRRNKAHRCAPAAARRRCLRR
jgi:hypothetical protein